MNPISPYAPDAPTPFRQPTGPTPSSDFARELGDAVKSTDGQGDKPNPIMKAMHEVQSLQDKADSAISQLAAGEGMDVHQVMVAFEQARLSMQMLVEVRNKVVEAYQDISRMPL